MRVILLAALLWSASAHAADPELQRLADRDQAVRTGAEDDSSDAARRQRVLAILGESTGLDARDKFNAALVLQHTELTVVGGKLASVSPDNYLLAHHLFLAAMRGGIEEAAYLAAAAMDRYLGFTEGYQRYGTNRVIDQDTGEERWLPIDRATSDAERARFGVGPLAELLTKFPEQPRAAGPSADARKND